MDYGAELAKLVIIKILGMPRTTSCRSPQISACHAPAKYRENVCFRAKVYTVNTGEVARPRAQVWLMVIEYAREHDTVYKVT